MSDSQDPEEAPRAPIIDHAAEGESTVETQRSAAPVEQAARHGSSEPLLKPPPVRPEVVRRGGTPVLLTLLLCAGLAGGIYWTWTHPHDEQPVAAPIDPAPAIAAAKADLLQQLQGLSDRIEKLEKAPPAAAPPPQPAAPAADALADISKRIDDLTGHLNALSEQQAQQSAILQKLQEQPGQPAPATGSAPPGAGEAQQQLADLGGKLDQALTQEKASLDALSQRLGKLEQDNAAATEAASNKQTLETLTSRLRKVEQGEGQIAGVKQDAALAVKLSAAQVALSAGEPLGDLPGAPPALARFATTPPPTEASLRADFPAVAQAALVASRPEESQKTLFSRALARLEQTITVRRGDHVIVGDPAAGVIAKAQQQLNDDDLAGAVQSLSALNGRAAQAVQGWVAQADALLAARAALAQLAAHG